MLMFLILNNKYKGRISISAVNFIPSFTKARQFTHANYDTINLSCTEYKAVLSPISFRRLCLVVARRQYNVWCLRQSILPVSAPARQPCAV
jgi:hypothetical protein